MKKPSRYRIGLKLKITLMMCLTTLIIVAVGISLGYFNAIMLVRNNIVADHGKIAFMLADFVSGKIDEEVEKIIGYSSNSLLTESIRKSNLKYETMTEDEIQRYLTNRNRRWMDAPDDSLLIEQYGKNAAGLFLQEIVKTKKHTRKIFVTDRFGGLVASSDKTSDYYPADKELWQKSFADGSGKTVIGKIQFDGSANMFVMPIAVPVKDGGNTLIGICKTVLDIKSFYVPLEQLKIGETGHLTVIDEKGNIIFHHGIEPLSMKFFTNKDFNVLMRSHRKWLVAQRTQVHEYKQVVVYADIENPLFLKNGMHWKICIDMDAKKIFAPINQLLLQAAVLSPFLIIILIPMAFFFSGLIVKPIKKLQEATQRIARGNLDYKVGTDTTDEIGELSRCVDRMTEDLKQSTTSIHALNKKIAHREQTEEALRESEKKYRRLMQTTSEGCWLINPECKTIEVNRALCEMLGYRQNEIIGKTPFDFVDDKNRKIFIEQTSKISHTTHRSYEITLKKKNGQDLHTYFNSTTLGDKSEAVQGSFAFVTDITQRKRAEQERDRLAVAIEQASESVFITDRNGTIQYVNPAFERVTGYSRKDAIGQNSRILKSGKQDALFYKQMWDTLAHGHAWKGHFINRKKDGSLYEADATISPILDKSDNIINFVSIKRDITREVELERNLIQSQKMESIGSLAGGIAHNFNNILSIILGNAELAVDDVPDTSLAKECLDEIRSASLRASDIVQQMLSFARKDLIEREPVKITPIIKNCLRLLRASIPATIEISQDISCEFDTVFADPTQISQVLMNLCSNAAQAMSEHAGVLKVILKNVEFVKQDEELEVKPGCYAALTVSDTGPGITPEVIDRIFDPYFTTKEVAKGTGMGLSVVHGIVKSCHGIITVNSEPGKGSLFEVLLPVFEAETQLKVEKPDTLPIGTERILFVDDEPSLVNIVRQILERLGYEVETRINPIEALDLFLSGPDRFDLVITDMTMPQMTGQRMVKEILDIRPDMPIILCTGFSDKISEEKAGEIGINALVFKPFVARDFSLTVRKVLDEK